MPLLSKVVGAVMLLGSVIGSPTPGDTATGSNGGSNGGVSAFVQKEKSVSLQGALVNIGSTGSLDQGADSGVVIASPSKVNPNYVYSWTRDSALTLKMIVDEFIGGNRGLEKTIKDYIKSVAIIQTLNNPSGNLATGTGLGEPKFLINEKPFLGAWGRPQRDGPALRAIALMSYVEYLLATNQKQTAKSVVWPIIANDLAYVGQYWNQTGFDLWEEVHGSSFFTIQNQYKSMVQGSILSRLVGVKCDACDSQAPQILCFLQSFWNGKYIVSNINTDNYQRTGLDSNSMLGPIAAFDIFGSCEDGTFQPCSSKVLSTHKQLVDSFRGIYGINSGRNPGQAAAVGRYAEDVYYGGNPWYLCTLSAAEVLYDAIAQWKIQRQIKVDSTSQAFFKDIYPQIQTKTYRSNDKEFNGIIAATSNYADGFVGIVQKYTPSNGSLSEQYSRNTGQPLSAYDLTWSFASFVTMAERRSGYYPVTWGSHLKNSIPSKCQGTSVQGTYAPATAAGAPPISDECSNPITFAVNASTYYGENLYIEGNITDLGSWDPTNSYGMQASNYTSTRHLWYITIQLPASTPINYNYFRVESDGSYIFENTNRTITVPPCGAGGFTTNDRWNGTCSTAPNCD